MKMNIEKKYIPLAHYFKASTEIAFTLTFSEIETIIGQKLPNAAYLNASWWKKTKPPLQHYLAWTTYGFAVSKVQLGFFIHFEKPQATNVEQSIQTAEKNYTYIVRSAELDDARSILNLFATLKKENSTFYYDHLHNPNTVQSLRKRISVWHTKNIGQFFVAVVDGQIGGFAQIIRNSSPYSQHRAEIEISVSQKYCNKQISTSLLHSIERWASTNSITRIELSIIQKSDGVVKRYENFGFSVEGIRKNALLIDHMYVDELYMGKLLP